MPDYPKAASGSPGGPRIGPPVHGSRPQPGAAGAARSNARFQPPPPPKTPSTIGRTAMPTKQHIRCYECGYEYNLTGRMNSTHCPKCKGALDLAGYMVDGECREELKTLGTIRVTSRANVSSARLLGVDIELGGRVVDSSVEAFNRIIIFPGADFDRKDIKTPDLKIEADAAVVFKSPAIYRDVEIVGSFEAPLYSTGVVTIRATGRFRGELHGGRLVVEDGAELTASMDIGPEGAERAVKMQEQNAGLSAAPREHIIVPAATQVAQA